MNKNIIQKTVWILKGFTLGVASLVPGISAGTLAVIMNIYEQIITTITHSFFPLKRKNIIFLGFLSIGFLTAIFSLADIISYLLLHSPLEIYCFFTGLILASLPKLLKMTDKKKKSFIIIFLTAILFFIFFKIMPNHSYQEEVSLLLFFTSGFVGFFASVLPGLSGSTILLIMGTYHFTLKVLTEINIIYLIFFISGGFLGLVCAFYFIQFFLKKKKNLFFCIIIGLIVGSLSKILPWEQWASTEIKTAFIKTTIFIFLGIFVFFFIEKKAFFTKK